MIFQQLKWSIQNKLNKLSECEENIKLLETIDKMIIIEQTTVAEINKINEIKLFSKNIIKQQISKQKLHDDYITSIAFKDNILVTGAYDERIKVWQYNEKEFELIKTLKNHSDYISGLLFVGDMLYSSSNSIVIFDQQYQKVNHISINGFVDQLIKDDNDKIGIRTDKSIQVYQNLTMIDQIKDEYTTFIAFHQNQLYYSKVGRICNKNETLIDFQEYRVKQFIIKESNQYVMLEFKLAILKDWKVQRYLIGECLSQFIFGNSLYLFKTSGDEYVFDLESFERKCYFSEPNQFLFEMGNKQIGIANDSLIMIH